MARKVCIIMGVGFLAVGVLGFVMPTFLGTHLSIVHTLIHFASGALALYFGLAGTMKGAKLFSIVFGALYAFLGLAGFIAGTRQPHGLPGLEHMGEDAYLLKLVPGYFEIGTPDHVLHLVIGAVFLAAGFMTVLTPRVKGTRMRVHVDPPIRTQRPMNQPH